MASKKTKKTSILDLIDLENGPTEELKTSESSELVSESSSEPFSDSTSETTSESTSESIEDQLSRLSQVMKELPVENSNQDTVEAEVASAESRLDAQIAEDLALEMENQQNLKFSQNDIELELPNGQDFNLEEIQSCMEAILFISDKPISFDKLKSYLGTHFSQSDFDEAIHSLIARYQEPSHGIELIEVAGGYQLRTKPGRASLAQKLVRVQTQRLSTGGMESLAIIAYKQPVMKEEIDKIRGVDSSYFVRGLLEKKLIQISGRSELPGRPILYSTTDEFLSVFGLKDLSALPSLRELEQMIPRSETRNPEDEDPRVREMRRLVGEMKADRSGDLHYNPKEDDVILKEIRERVTAIPTSTPYLDDLKAAEILAEQQKNQVPVTEIEVGAELVTQ